MAKKIKISLAAARVNANMTQADVAKFLRITPNTVCNWEKGRTSPTVNQVQELCKIYKIPFDALFVPDISK